MTSMCLRRESTEEGRTHITSARFVYGVTPEFPAGLATFEIRARTEALTDRRNGYIDECVEHLATPAITRRRKWRRTGQSWTTLRARTGPAEGFEDQTPHRYERARRSFVAHLRRLTGQGLLEIQGRMERELRMEDSWDQPQRGRRGSLADAVQHALTFCRENYMNEEVGFTALCVGTAQADRGLYLPGVPPWARSNNLREVDHFVFPAFTGDHP